ncbi:MAG: hypothetical protein NVS3B16_16070 [Vulcanimicrobiaceae bacterium]
MIARPPPGPGARGALAFVRAVSAGTVLAYFAELARRYGPVSSLPLGPQRIVFVDEPRLIEELLVTRQHEFVRDTGASLLRELVGEGLLTTDDPAHLRRRRLMQPAFHRARVAAYAQTIVGETERVVAGWDLARPLDLGAEMARLALAAVGASLFGADLRDEASAVASVLARVTQRGGALAGLLAVAGPLLGPLRRAFPGRASLLFPRERAELEAIVAPLIARERERTGGGDLLSLLLEARDRFADTHRAAAAERKVGKPRRRGALPAVRCESERIRKITRVPQRDKWAHEDARTARKRITAEFGRAKRAPREGGSRRIEPQRFVEDLPDVR